MEKITKTEDLLKNCRYCPSYQKTCDGNDKSCLCLRCPRNLGQCIKVRYCRETESVLEDFTNPRMLKSEDIDLMILEKLKRMKDR